MCASQEPGELFLHGFRERVRAAARPGQDVIDEPGLVALLGHGPDLLDGRVLVTDDRAFPTLERRLPDLHARVINVFAGARQSERLLTETPGYRAEPCVAMVSAALDELPALDLPGGLELRTVSPTPGTAGEVSIEQAAVAALRSDANAAPIEDLDGFAAYLRAVPNACFLAAVDDAGEVRATSAAANFGTTAAVFFVNTDPGWRGQGIGTTMTAAALRAAVDAGAEVACLDASALGLPIYRRLGFREVSANTLFARKD